MMKKGIYCSGKQQIVEDVHAGARVKNSYYHHLCFYFPDNVVGFYGGERLWTKPFTNRSFRYTGEVTAISDTRLEFYINDPYTNDRILFTGVPKGEQIEIVAVRESDPQAIWLEDTFEFIGEG